MRWHMSDPSVRQPNGDRQSSQAASVDLHHQRHDPARLEGHKDRYADAMRTPRFANLKKRPSKTVRENSMLRGDYKRRCNKE